jgi:GTP cyclohydrolase I
MFNIEAAENAIRQLIEAVGEDPQRQGLVQTPRRVAEMYREVFAGLHADPQQPLAVEFDEGHHGLVMVRDIEFSSMCEHHFLPFMGTAQVGYIADGRIVGISKVARLVDLLAKRPQVQERLTNQVADHLWKALRPKGVAVLMEAEHLCMTIRGVRKPGTRVVTTAMRGQYCDDAAAREEFMTLSRSA